MHEWKSNTLKTCENILMKEASILAKNQSFKFQTIFHLKKNWLQGIIYVLKTTKHGMDSNLIIKVFLSNIFNFSFNIILDLSLFVKSLSSFGFYNYSSLLIFTPHLQSSSVFLYRQAPPPPKIVLLTHSLQEMSVTAGSSITTNMPTICQCRVSLFTFFF